MKLIRLLNERAEPIQASLTLNERPAGKLQPFWLKADQMLNHIRTEHKAYHSLIICVSLRHLWIETHSPFDDHCDALTSPDAKSSEAAPKVPPAQLVEQRN